MQTDVEAEREEESEREREREREREGQREKERALACARALIERDEQMDGRGVFLLLTYVDCELVSCLVRQMDNQADRQTGS